jgi:hypothetical protein
VHGAEVVEGVVGEKKSQAQVAMRVQHGPRQRKPKASPRDTVMISHANPEDNEFTLWLALQLAKEGYKVWTDLTDLLGGESFWSDIEHVIRTRAVKFIYVLSRTSNESNRGFRKELHLADSEAKKLAATLPRFVVPVAVDDLRSGDYNIYVQHLNCIPSRNWAKGLTDILELFQRDKVPQFRREFNAKRVTSWWQRFRSAKAGIKRKPDKYLSNWFPIVSLPTHVYLHELEAVDEKFPTVDFDVAWLFAQRGGQVLTFAAEASFKSVGDPICIAAKKKLELNDVLGSSEKRRSDSLKPMVSELLRRHWETWIAGKRLGTYELANNSVCSFFKQAKGVDSLWASYRGVDGDAGRRTLVGIFTKRVSADPETRSKHYWHFGIQGRPRLWPEPVIHISAHVLFSDNGETIWESKRRLHSARRRQCKSWYNDEWRDRLLASMAFLADGKDTIDIEVVGGSPIKIALTPELFESKITCVPLEKTVEKEEVPGGEEEGGDQEDDDEEGEESPDAGVPL